MTDQGEKKTEQSPEAVERHDALGADIAPAGDQAEDFKGGYHPVQQRGMPS